MHCSKSNCAEATFINPFSFSISAGISDILMSFVLSAFLVISIVLTTFLIMVFGTMPCAALYSL